MAPIQPGVLRTVMGQLAELHDLRSLSMTLSMLQTVCAGVIFFSGQSKRGGGAGHIG